jgi:hypothetical protein
MAQGVKQSTIEEMIKDKIKIKIVKVKHNYLFILVIHYLQITPLTKRAYKDIL